MLLACQEKVFWSECDVLFFHLDTKIEGQSWIPVKHLAAKLIKRTS